VRNADTVTVVYRAEDPTALLRTDPEPWDEGSVPLHERGVRLGWLTELAYSVSRHLNAAHFEAEASARSYEEWDHHERNSAWLTEADRPAAVPEYRPYVPPYEAITTRNFVERWLKPATAEVRGPLYALVPDDARGKPGRFISHSWNSPLCLEGMAQKPYGMLNALEPTSVSGVKEEFVWMDICCYNQHGSIDVAPDMYSVIGSIGAIAFPVTAEGIFDRTWCLWELLCAAKNDANIKFCVYPGYATDQRVIVRQFKEAFAAVEQAKATNPADRVSILHEMERHFGSLAAADDYIADLLQDKLSFFDWFSTRR
jgi:hypothetical protein